MLPPGWLPAQEGEVKDGCQFVAETPDAGYSCSGEPCHLAPRAMSLDREQITPVEQDRPLQSALQRNLSSHLGGCLHKRERSRMAAGSWRRHPMQSGWRRHTRAPSVGRPWMMVCCTEGSSDTGGTPPGRAWPTLAAAYTGG